MNALSYDGALAVIIIIILIMCDVRFKHHFKCLLAGPSAAGKTTWICRFLRERDNLIDAKVKQVVFYYDQWQELYDSMAREKLVDEFVKGKPTVETFQKLAHHEKNTTVLVVIDDQQHRADPDLARIFQVTARHSGCSVMYLCQSLFSPKKSHREISLQADYIVLFRNPRDMLSISHFARQVCPGKSNVLVDIYREATKKPYSYLLMDFHQMTNNHLRFRTNIFKGDDDGCQAYVMHEDGV